MTTKTSQPGWLSPFSWAVVRLATYLPEGSRLPNLVFGTVSLLSPDRPSPDSDPDVAKRTVRADSKGRVFFRRVAMRAPDAVAWYLTGGTDGFGTPIPAAPGDFLEGKDGTAVASSPLQDDPPWPTLGLPADDGPSLGGDAAAPFLGFGSARVHRRFSVDPTTDAVAADLGAVAFLASRLHMDLTLHPEYLGSLALVAPDPLLRSVEHFIVPPATGGAERVVIRLVPIARGGLADLSITVVERQSELLTKVETRRVPEDGLVVLESLGEVGSSGYTLCHPAHGVLDHQPPLPFVRNIALNMELGARQVAIAVPTSESPDAPSETSYITEFGDSRTSTILPDRPGRDFGHALSAAADRRRAMALARNLDQVWLEDRAAALSFLRERVARARQRVWVADPYLGERQLLQVIHHIPRLDVAIRLITSRLAFENGGVVDGEVRPETAKQRLSGFRAGLAGLRGRGFPVIEALVLQGKSPPLHDRFLVVDRHAWFLGNSLNALGDRASLALRIPDPVDVVRRLDALAKQAEPFAAYLKRRASPPAGD